MVRALSVDVSFASCSARNVEYCHRSPVYFMSFHFIVTASRGEGESLVPPHTRESVSVSSFY